MVGKEAWSYALGGLALAAISSTLLAVLWQLRWSLLLLWGLAELMFYTFVWLPRFRAADRQPVPHAPPGAVAEGTKQFQRCLQLIKAHKGFDYRAYLSGWFKDAPFEDVQRGNLEEFIAYGFFYSTPQQLEAEGHGHLPAQCADLLEQAWGITLPAGYNAGISGMKHLWEPLKATWHPLAFYATTNTVGLLSRHLLSRWGFQHHRHNGMPYHTLRMQPRSMCTAAEQAAPALQEHQSVHCKPSLAAAAAAEGKAAAPQQSATADAEANGAMLSPSNSEEGWTPFCAPSKAALPAFAPGDQACDDLAGPRDQQQLQQQLQQQAAANGSTDGLAGAGMMSAPVSGAHSDGRRVSLHSTLSAAPTQATSASCTGTFPGLLSASTLEALNSDANPLHQALSQQDVPILFLHGVGGLAGYLEMLMYLMALGNPLIAVEFEGVSLRFGAAQSPSEIADSVVGVLDKLGVARACVVGHSFGTFIAACLARRYPQRVHHICLMDAVCFGMFMPNLLKNFVYRLPELRGWTLRDFLNYVKFAGRRLFVREVNLCASVCRGFYWTELNLWPEDLPAGSVVMLSGKDDLMDSAQVKATLEAAGHVKVMYNADFAHGAFLFDQEVKLAIKAEIKSLLAHSGHAVAGLATPMLSQTMSLLQSAITHIGTGAQRQVHRRLSLPRDGQRRMAEDACQASEGGDGALRRRAGLGRASL